MAQDLTPPLQGLRACHLFRHPLSLIQRLSLFCWRGQGSLSPRGRPHLCARKGTMPRAVPLEAPGCTYVSMCACTHVPVGAGAALHPLFRN